MAMVENGLIKKLKLGLAGLSIIGASYFNSVQAQTIKPKPNTKNHPTLIHKLIEFENEPLNGSTTCANLEKNSLDEVIKRMKKHIPKKPASELSKKEAQELFLKIDSAMYGQICRLDGECYQTAYMYHAVGDFYDLPINLVMTPPYGGEYHIFARWDAKRDGHDPLNSENQINEGDFNWDNESHLFLKKDFPLNDNDKYFIEEFFIPQETIEKGIYMKNLNEKEMLAFSHVMRAKFLSFQTNDLQAGTPKGRKIAEKIYGEIINTLDEAIKLDSLCMPAYSLKASCLGQHIMNPNSDFEEAVKTVNKALESNPKDPKLWELKGIIHDHHYGIKEKEDSLERQAIKYYDKAIDLLEEYKKIELSKKDRLVMGINYAKLYVLTEQERKYLSWKGFVYNDLNLVAESHFNLKIKGELNKKLEFYKKKCLKILSNILFGKI